MRGFLHFIPGALRGFRLAGYSLLASGASAAPVILYDGNASPTAQGWTRHSRPGPNGPGTETVGAGTTEFNTDISGPLPDDQRSAANEYRIVKDATNFVVSIRLKAAATGFNTLDAALTFSAFGWAAATGPVSDRFNNVAISPGRIQFGNEVGGFYTLDTTIYHEYAMRLLNGNLTVYVDANFADIVAGTAVPVMSRTNVVPQTGRIPGQIVFGDATDDPHVDSRYTVDFVKFDDYGPPRTIPVTNVAFTLTAPAQGTITFASTPNVTYQVQASSTLLPDSWTPIGSILATVAATSINIVAANPTSGQLTDPLLATAPKRFYRIVQP